MQTLKRSQSSWGEWIILCQASCSFELHCIIQVMVLNDNKVLFVPLITQALNESTLKQILNQFCIQRFLKTFYFEIITRLIGVAEIVQRFCVPFTQFLPTATFYTTTIYCQSEEINIGTVCVCVWFCVILSHVNLCNHLHSQNTELFQHHQDFIFVLCWFFCVLIIVQEHG